MLASSNTCAQVYNSSCCLAAYTHSSDVRTPSVRREDSGSSSDKRRSPRLYELIKPPLQVRDKTKIILYSLFNYNRIVILLIEYNR